jgi:hypothetical protein
MVSYFGFIQYLSQPLVPWHSKIRKYKTSNFSFLWLALWEVSRRLPTAAARVRAQVRSCVIRGGQSGTGTEFLRVLRFPLSIPIPPTAQHSSSIIRGWHNRPVGGRRTKWTVSPHLKKLKKKKNLALWDFSRLFWFSFICVMIELLPKNHCYVSRLHTLLLQNFFSFINSYFGNSFHNGALTAVSNEKGKCKGR